MPWVIVFGLLVKPRYNTLARWSFTHIAADHAGLSHSRSKLYMCWVLHTLISALFLMACGGEVSSDFRWCSVCNIFYISITTNVFRVNSRFKNFHQQIIIENTYLLKKHFSSTRRISALFPQLQVIKTIINKYFYIYMIANDTVPSQQTLATCWRSTMLAPSVITVLNNIKI